MIIIRFIAEDENKKTEKDETFRKITFSYKLSVAVKSFKWPRPLYEAVLDFRQNIFGALSPDFLRLDVFSIKMFIIRHPE